MKTFRVLLASLTVLIPFGSLFAQEACPCVPISYQWIVEPCETWNCAASAFISSNGDKFLLTMPTNDETFKWVVIRRVVAGSVYIPPNAPFVIDAFDRSAIASAHLDAMNQLLVPMMLSAPDGKFLVVARSAPISKQRVVAH